MATELTPDNESFIQHEVALGAFQTREDAIEAGVALLKKRRELIDRLAESRRHQATQQVGVVGEHDSLRRGGRTSRHRRCGSRCRRDVRRRRRRCAWYRRGNNWLTRRRGRDDSQGRRRSTWYRRCDNRRGSRRRCHGSDRQGFRGEITELAAYSSANRSAD